MEPPPDYVLAHRHCIRHYREILASDSCGCFQCLAVFEPSAVHSWLSDGPSEAERSALCPHCGCDTVIGSASGFPLTAELLCRMKQRWCSESEASDGL